jgi:DNA replication protein DnaC
LGKPASVSLIFQKGKRKYELLILDGLGTERNSEYALGIVFSVIDRRYRVTTYLPIKQLKADLLLPN